MTALNKDTEILNGIVSSMRVLLGDYASMTLRGVSGLMMDESGKITKVENFKSAISTLANKYEKVIGNSANVRIADLLAPYVQKNKKLRNDLPKSIRDVLMQAIDISGSLSKWSKSTAKS